jgi:hypothetical protein
MFLVLVADNFHYVIEDKVSNFIRHSMSGCVLIALFVFIVPHRI